MKAILSLFPWKTTLYISLVLLVLQNIFSFYGIYTNSFYFFNLENYILPVLSVVHFIYLYAVWFKIREKEYPDLPMRNLEYGLYLISFVYLYKAIDYICIVLSHDEYKNFLLSDSFVPLGSALAVMHIFLVLMTLLTFLHRKISVGKYDFSDFNENTNSWN